MPRKGWPLVTSLMFTRKRSDGFVRNVEISGKAVFVGDGIGLFKKEIEKAKLKAEWTDEKSWYPKAGCLAQLALKRFEAGQLDDIDKLVPMYLYPEDCQVQK